MIPSCRCLEPLRNLLALAAGLAIAIPALPAAAAVPGTTTIEGILQSSAGGPAADGSYPVVFSLYKDESGGLAVWSEGPVAISLKNGQFSHNLGSKVALTQQALASLGAQAFLGIKVDTDPELPRKPLSSVMFSLRAAIAEGLDCSGCISAGHIDAKALEPYAKTAALAKVATTGKYADLDGGPDLSAYAKIGALAKVATSGAYADLTGGPDLTPYAKTAGLAKVATTGKYVDLAGAPTLSTVAGTGAYADLKGAPVLAKLGASCGTGLVIKGLKADGSYECVQAMDPTALPGDGIDEISNGLIWNQFTDSVAGKVGVAILDNNPDGTIDKITFPDIGLAQKLTVSVDLTNSKIETLTVSLIDPAGVEYVLHNKSGSGTVLKTSWPTPTPTANGDLTTWVGKNPKGQWTLKVIDGAYLNNTTDGQIKAWSIDLSTLSSKKIQVKGDLIVDGSVQVGKDAAACATAKTGAMRYNNNTIEVCDGTAWQSLSIFQGFPASKIVTPKWSQMINGWVGNPSREWKLCYRRSDDGAAASTFHSKCNGKGDTVTIAKLDNGQTMGGYAGCSWYSKNTYNYQCGGSFLFNLTKGHKFNKRTYHVSDSSSFSYQNWIYDYSSYGPTWGGGHDWHIQSNMTNGYCNLGHDYTCRVGTSNGYSGYGDAVCQSDLCGSYSSWNIQELEVWYAM